MILVLEDMQVRVDWLRDAVGDTNADEPKVCWSTKVSQLLIDLDNVIPSLVILDHDLGDLRGGDFTRGRDGHNGMDACRLMPVVDCPVLVWSMNTSAAPLMVEKLRSRGMRAVWAPFGTNACAAHVALALLSEVA